MFVLLLCCCRICTHWQYKLYTFSCFRALSAQIPVYLSAAVHCRAPLAQVVSAVLITTRQWTQGRARTDHNILLCRASLLRTHRQLRQILQILTHGGNISSSLHHGHIVNYVRGWESEWVGRATSAVGMRKAAAWTINSLTLDKCNVWAEASCQTALPVYLHVCLIVTVIILWTNYRLWMIN